LRQLLPSARGDSQRSAVRDARDPAALEKGLREARAHGAGDVRPALGPVDTGAAVPPLRAACSLEIDAETGEESRAGLRQLAASPRRSRDRCLPPAGAATPAK